MDLLFKRYASPIPLLDNYIQTSRFCEFIEALNEAVFEDKKWEYWLFKVLDKSYGEYCVALQTEQQHKTMSVFDVESTVKNSMEILNNFTPQGEGEKNDII